MPERKTLDTALNEIIKDKLKEIHTLSVGIVVSYNKTEITASIQPTIMRKYKDTPTPEPLAQIDDVPVIFPGGGGYHLTFDLLPGDPVLLGFCERNIEAFMTTGAVSPPTDSRKFDLSDAVAIPGIIPIPRLLVPPPESNAICLRDTTNTTKIKLSAGEIAIAVPGSETIISIPGTIKVKPTPVPVLTDVLVYAPAGLPSPGYISLATHTHTSAAPGSLTTPPVTIPGPP